MTFIRNAWYAAAWSHEIQRTLLARTILQDPVVLFRREDGEAAALADRCPHRFVPLHRGTLKGDTVECGYHGLCFNAKGACVHNPHGNGLVPRAAQVRDYPLAESQGVVWIWMGQPELADPAAIVCFEPLEDPAFETVRGYLHVNANYQLISDNLLDLTHGQYVHPMFRNAAGPAAMEESPVCGDTVWARFVRRDQLPNRYFKMLGFPPEQHGDHRNYMRWNPPGNLLLDVGMTTVGGRPEEGLSIPTTHLLTPETETTSHYFWAMSRNFKTHDQALSDELLRVGIDIFTNEDKPVIEAQQAYMRSETDLFKMRPILLSTDAPAVRARRILKERVEKEQAREAAVPVAAN